MAPYIMMQWSTPNALQVSLKASVRFRVTCWFSAFLTRGWRLPRWIADFFPVRRASPTGFMNQMAHWPTAVQKEQYWTRTPPHVRASNSQLEQLSSVAALESHSTLRRFVFMATLCL